MGMKKQCDHKFRTKYTVVIAVRFMGNSRVPVTFFPFFCYVHFGAAVLMVNVNYIEVKIDC